LSKALGKKFSYMLGSEAKTILGIEKAYMTKRRNSIYIALGEGEINFIWDEKEVERFRELWRSDLSIEKISEELNRPVNDVAILVFDQSIKRRIDPRKGGLMGI